MHLLTQFDEYIPRIEHEFDGIHPLSIDRSGTNPIRDFLTFCNIMGWLNKLKPSVFLTFSIKPVIYGGLASRMMGVKAIPNITGLGAVFIKSNWKTWLVRRLYRQALYRSARVFFQNEDDRQLFIGDGLVGRELTDRLPGSGVDLARFTYTPRISSDTRERPFRFLLIARMLWDKGVKEYVEAARQIRQSYPQAEFCLLGFVNVQNPAAISSNQMDEWVAEGVINYLGVSDDVRKQISTSDCVVLPSYREGTPRTLLEAAAMGRPIITTDAVGCREVVDDWENGLLCKTRDPRDLAKKMQQMIRLSEEERCQMGKKGRLKVEKEFDEKIVIKKYLLAIKSFIEDSEASKSSFAYWVFLLACIAVILFSLYPKGVEINSVLSFSWGDKLLHVLIFATLCYIGLKAFCPQIVRLCFGLLLLGGFIEVAQSYTESSHAGLGDFIANIFGIILGVVIFKITRNGKIIDANRFGIW